MPVLLPPALRPIGLLPSRQRGWFVSALAHTRSPRRALGARPVRLPWVARAARPTAASAALFALVRAPGAPPRLSVGSFARGSTFLRAAPCPGPS
eukprot:8664164-Alexandrium_andersonii.AAC.1